MLKKILFGLLAVIVLAALGGFLYPSKLHIEKSMMIHGNHDVVQAQLVNFKNFNSWSPWAKLDPETKYEYSDQQGVEGATMSWSSEDSHVGSGKMVLTKVGDNEILYETSFEGWSAASPCGYKIAEVDGGTEVVWFMDMDFGLNPIYRYMGAFMMEEAILKDYEQGLVNLNAVVEKKMEAEMKMLEAELADVSSSEDAEVVEESVN
ncbi:SRPBCC family protein [Limibacter armeniacum]|uniref:SRPBCC family protein n=1 Tax=Limibacter armeniacum TaxID=466084 RepID=UPI002FE6354C